MWKRTSEEVPTEGRYLTWLGGAYQVMIYSQEGKGWVDVETGDLYDDLDLYYQPLPSPPTT
jgi:hypothetical protein